MGYLTAVMLAHAEPARIFSFINIKGNRAPEDGFPELADLYAPLGLRGGVLPGTLHRVDVSLVVAWERAAQC
jgi:hypothetical protein